MSGSSHPKGGEVDPRIGTLLADRYRIDALVGEGGMGKVYSAEHVLMRKRLAVKVLRRELTSVPEVVARFEREAMAAANIEHPNVAAATDFGKLADGAVFLVLEFVSGQSLRDEIARGVFDVGRALHVARQIASALTAAHAQGIVHRDLKPENVMLVEKGGDPDFVKVLDFGIAKVPLAGVSEGTKSGSPITKAGMVFGTPEYMSPEQALGQNVDGRADLYALGVMFFEMLSGLRPFSSLSSVGILGQQLSKLPPSIAERAPGLAVPPAAEQIAHKLLARDASQRYQSAAEVARAIDALLSPIPGHGVYRFTLADGSPSTPSGSESSRAPLEPSPSVSAGVQQVPLPAGPVSRLPTLARSVWQRLTASFVGFVRGFERARRKWPAPVRETLRKVPTRVLVLATLFVAASLVVGLFALGVKGLYALGRAPGPAPSARNQGPRTERPEALPSAPASATESELKDAVQAGLPALELLAAKYPGDARLALEAAHGALLGKDYVKAVASASRALNLDPTLSSNKQLSTILFQSAQVKAASDATFALLAGAMGAHGPDIAYDLAATEAVKPIIRARADQGLRSPALSRLATPELAVAVALRFATNCQQRHALLPRAKEIGDERALGYLNQYRATTGCGRRQRSDCNGCLRGDSQLTDTIEAIKQRIPHDKGTP